jgi:DNA-binding transcriptional MocR family regulator
VVAAPPPSIAEPGMSRPDPRPTEVGIGPLALMVLRDAMDANLTPFGPAMPDPAFLPVAELEAITAKIARAGLSGIGRYGVPPGARDLRMRLARRAMAHGCALGPDDLVITNGALDAVTLALRATCVANDTVAIESPMYYGLLQSIEALGLRVVEIPTHPRDGMSLVALREALDEHRIAAVVASPNFNNPLGSCASDEAKRELVDLLGKRDIPLIEDDCLGDLAHDGTRPKPAKAFDTRGTVLWCSSFSKTVAPGLRVGWIAPGRYRATVEHLQFTNTVAGSPLTQAVMAEFLASGGHERFLRRARAEYGGRCAGMAEAVARHFPGGTHVTRPAGGFVLWVELPEAVDAQKLYAAALEARIAITPGHLFSAKRRYRHFIRLNAAAWSPGHDGRMQVLGKLARRMA